MGWEQVGEEIVKRRVELGHNSREAFARSSGLSPRLLADLEHGTRTSYDRATIVRLENALRWLPGSVAAVLDGRHPTKVEDADDTRPVEREGDDLALMQLLAASGLPPADQLRITRHVRRRRAEQHAELAAEVRALIASAGGDLPATAGPAAVPADVDVPTTARNAARQIPARRQVPADRER
jgi:hypothetical protein